MPRLQKDKANFILQQNGATAHFLGNVHDYLNAELPGGWTGRASGDGNPLFLWSPSSPDLTSRIFSNVVTLKIASMYPFFYVILTQVKERMEHAAVAIDSDMLQGE